METLANNRACILILFVIGIVLFVTINSQTTGMDEGPVKEMAFTGSATLVHVPLFLFLLTELFGPIAKNRSKVNKFFAWTFIIPSGLISLLVAYGFFSTLLFVVFK